MKNYISLGAGVQSSCLAYMAAEGEFEDKVDAAIFADVGAEPQSVYNYLEHLKETLPFPVYTVTHKDGLLADIVNGVNGERSSSPPFYTKSENGEMAIVLRKCTRDFKIRPLMKKQKELAGLTRKRLPKSPVVSSWIGISLDEIQRMKMSREKWCENRFPLIEKRMSRHDCMMWMEKRGYKMPPRSACWFCPYHSNHEWRRLKNEEPEEFEKAVALDKMIRPNFGGLKQQVYLHKSGLPLDEVDLRTDEEKGQTTFFDTWNNECDGMCGL